MLNYHVLIVDDNQKVLDSLRLLTHTEFSKVICIKSPERIPLICHSEDIDVVLLDMNFSGGHQSGQEGLYWLSRIQEVNPAISVIFITAYGAIELAVEALKRGASDFVNKPWTNEKILSALISGGKVARSKKSVRIKQDTGSGTLAQPEDQTEIIGQSLAIQKIHTLISKVAATDANVLILGENGTGKELVTHQIHALSKRNKNSLLSVDLGAIPSGLFESELFGHEKGAFTDAKEARIGKFEAASGGTLFLDEIANLPLSMQPKLLSVLQNRVIFRLGSNVPIPVDIRLITATNRDPSVMVSEGTFREDLLYRINTIVIHVPPLRQRKEDVPLLARHFLQRYAHKYEKSELTISKEADEKLMKHHWPGNVRELQHCLERAVILADHTELGRDDLDLDKMAMRDEIPSYLTLEEMEEKMIQSAIREADGNMTLAAKKLGITRQTLYNKMKRKNP